MAEHNSTTTTGANCFRECLKHSGKSQKHSGKHSPSATLWEELPGKRLTGKSSSPSAKNRTLEEDFPECHGSTRGEDLTPSTGFFLLFPERNTRGRNFFFFATSSPSATLGEEICFFLEISSPSASCPGTRGRPLSFF
jgi:hypothetical protein